MKFLINYLLSKFRRYWAIAMLGLSLTVIWGCWHFPDSQQQSVVASDAPRFGLPIACSLGKDCFIMHYVDRDPSAKEVDFNCGRQTYDNHKGTDFGIADLEAMQDGVSVIAASDGKVLRIRDGVADRLITDIAQKNAVAGEECGNGIVIDSGNGWETQYCHLKQDSIVVQPDMEVKKGTVLGMVGASGLASFPHVHLTIRHRGEVIDPFSGVEMDAAGGCEGKDNSLWDIPLDYTPTGLVRAGFADTPPTETELWEGKYKETKLSADSPALLFWVQAYGVLSGDREQWQLIAPDGEIAIDRENTLDKPYRSWVSYVGKQELTPGKWQGKYELMREGNSVISVSRSLVVR